ncbi:MAG: hypothetical protein AAFQ09_01335 [Pseudomonadota bacterium]
MMLRQLNIRFAPWSVVMLVALSGCERPPIWSSGDSLANRLELGMSPSDVSAIIGNPEFLDISETDPSLICRSYIYDEAIDAKFVHVVFDNNKLVSARDGFRAACVI